MKTILMAAALCAGGPVLAAAAEPRPELTVQTRSASIVTSLAVSRDGKFGAAADIQNNVKLWNLETGALIRTIKAEGQFGVRLAFAPNRTLLTGSGDRLSFWDLETGREREEMRMAVPFAIASIDHSKDFSLMAAAGGRWKEPGEVQLWDMKKGEQAGTFEGELAAMSPDGRFLVTGGAPRIEDGGAGKDGGPAPLKVWDPRTGKLLRTLGDHQVLGMSAGPEGVLVAHQRDSALVFDLNTGRRLGTIVPPNPGGKGFIRFARAIASDEIAIGWVKELQVWSASGKKLKTLPFESAVLAAAPIPGPDGRLLVAEMRGGALTVYDLDSEEIVRRLEGASDSAGSVSISAGGKYLAMATQRAAFLVDLAGEAPIKTFPYSYRIAVSADETSVLTASVDPKSGALSTSVRSAKSGKILSSTKNEGLVMDAVLGGSEAYLTFEKDRSVAAWTPAGRKLSEFRLPWQMGGMFPKIALAPDGKKAMAVVGENGDELKSLDFTTGKIGSAIPTGGELMALAVGTGLDAIAGGYALGNILYVSPAEEGAVRIDARGRFEEEGKELPDSGADKMLMMSAMAISPDGSLLAATGVDGFVRVWSPASKALTAELRGHTASVEAIAISPDNALLASAGDDHAVRLWDLKKRRELCRIVPVADGWVAITPDGYFDGSPEALKSVRWTIGLESYALEAFSEGYYVPGLLARLTTGAKVGSAKQAKLSEGFSLPPSVTIVSPKAGATLDAAAVEVTVAAQDEGGGVDEIRLYHNGKALGGESRGMKGVKQRTQTFTVTLADGANVLRAVALSRARIEGNPAEITVTYAGAKAKSRLHLLAVGLNAYKNSALNLNYAKPDAQGLLKFFAGAPRNLFNEPQSVSLYDAAATKAGILGSLASLESSAPDDVVVIYLAGHGDSVGADWYFIPHELVYPEKEGEIAAKGISAAELQAAVGRIGARKVVLLLDSCKSGSALSSFAVRGFEDRKALAKLARAAGVHVVAAASKDQFAAEVKELGHGVFTYTLLQALGGKADGSPKDGVVTIRELMSYVESELPELSQKYQTQAQYPTVRSDGMDFPITTVKAR